jgi:branched-chain amino acid transport system permease protein
LYLGLVFVFMVMFAPGGIASLVMMNLRVAAFGHFKRLWVAYLALAGTGAAALAGLSAMIEMLYHLQLNAALGPTLHFMGATLDAQAADSWFGAAFVLLAGGALFEFVRRVFKAEWDDIQQQIERELKRREAAA